MTRLILGIIFLQPLASLRSVMVGDRSKRKITEQITEAVKDTAGKAGALITAAFALAGAALLLALAVFVFALRTRRA
jgi:hypothetical protein